MFHRCGRLLRDFGRQREVVQGEAPVGVVVDQCERPEDALLPLERDDHVGAQHQLGIARELLGVRCEALGVRFEHRVEVALAGRQRAAHAEVRLQVLQLHGHHVAHDRLDVWIGARERREPGRPVLHRDRKGVVRQPRHDDRGDALECRLEVERARCELGRFREQPLAVLGTMVVVDVDGHVDDAPGAATFVQDARGTRKVPPIHAIMTPHPVLVDELVSRRQRLLAGRRDAHKVRRVNERVPTLLAEHAVGHAGVVEEELVGVLDRAVQGRHQHRRRGRVREPPVCRFAQL